MIIKQVESLLIRFRKFLIIFEESIIFLKTNETMETKKNTIYLLSLIIVVFSCKTESKNEEAESKRSITEIKKDLASKGYQTFDYIDPETKDTILMQQYFMAFLKSGPTRSQTKEEADSLQTLHLEHLQKMYNLGYADISGPFGDNGDIRGITIYNTPTIEMADSLANSDPMVKSGRLVIEMHPWWAAKGFSLR